MAACIFIYIGYDKYNYKNPLKKIRAGCLLDNEEHCLIVINQEDGFEIVIFFTRAWTTTFSCSYVFLRQDVANFELWQNAVMCRIPHVRHVCKGLKKFLWCSKVLNILTLPIYLNTIFPHCFGLYWKIMRMNHTPYSNM